MKIIDRDFFDGLYLTTQPDMVDGTRCMHVEPPLFPPVEYEGRTVYVVRAWRSKQLLDDTVSQKNEDGSFTALPVESCDASSFTADQLKDIWDAIESGDLSSLAPSAPFLIAQDKALGLDTETIMQRRGGIIGDFIGFTVEEARQFKSDLFALIDAAVAAQQAEEV